MKWLAPDDMMIVLLKSLFVCLVEKLIPSNNSSSKISVIDNDLKHNKCFFFLLSFIDFYYLLSPSDLFTSTSLIEL